MVWRPDSPQKIIADEIYGLTIAAHKQYRSEEINLSFASVRKESLVELPGYEKPAKVLISKGHGEEAIIQTKVYLPPNLSDAAFKRMIGHGSLISKYSCPGRNLEFSGIGTNTVSLTSPIGDLSQQFTIGKDNSGLHVLLNEDLNVDQEMIDIHPPRIHYNEDLLRSLLGIVFRK